MLSISQLTEIPTSDETLLISTSILLVFPTSIIWHHGVLNRESIKTLLNKSMATYFSYVIGVVSVALCTFIPYLLFFWILIPIGMIVPTDQLEIVQTYLSYVFGLYLFLRFGMSLPAAIAGVTGGLGASLEATDGMRLELLTLSAAFVALMLWLVSLTTSAIGVLSLTIMSTIVISSVLNAVFILRSA